ncbi:MAPEG family protein [Sphingomicrobium arenosum]|uniref:MAPEG family protein n=1 Tax=Sphingomicrobium arenosum TaxID=2233861 RepID=UPI002240F4E3|nr:MAPEG family protein [Sphingomicrobium arenosum]
MHQLTFDNPVFATFAASAAALSLLAILTAWIVVLQTMRHKGGFRAPEDLKRTPLNLRPNANQTAPIEAVERYRRIMLNHLENLPFFFILGLLFVLTGPSLGLAQWLFWGYVASRMAHFLAYATAQIHDVRATFWTIGSVILVAMALMVLQAAIAAL